MHHNGEKTRWEHSIRHNVRTTLLCNSSNLSTFSSFTHNPLKKSDNSNTKSTRSSSLTARNAIGSKSYIRIWQSWLFKFKNLRSFKLTHREFKLTHREILLTYPSDTFRRFNTLTMKVFSSTNKL